MSDGTRDFARWLLAAIRILNGGAGLFFPDALAHRLGIDPEQNPGALYFIRLFGVRTVVIGADLLRSERRADALREAVLIHGSDTLAAGIAAFSGRLPAKVGLSITLISALNTVLALLASRGR
jgi:hypothetical protein